MTLSSNPERLSKGWPRPYVYPSAMKRGAARLLDFFMSLVFPPSPLSIPWHRIGRVAVLRLDHMGDVLNSFEALHQLRLSLPKARIDLFTGRWGKDAAAMSDALNDIFVVDVPWFQRGKRIAWPWKAIAALGQRLRVGRYDLVIELRGDLRHHLAARLSGAPWRLGCAQTAGKFLLTHPVMFQAGLHESDQNLRVLKTHGLKFQNEKISGLKISSEAKRQAADLAENLKLKKTYVAIQAACGTQAKRWQAEKWAELIDRMIGQDIVLLGSADERAEMMALAKLCKHKPKIAAGHLSLQGLAAFLKNASLLISVDSGPAHLAARVGTKVISLYSGTNRAEQWTPRGGRVRLIQKKPACWPCELSVCPFNNECMRRIEVDEVMDLVGAF